MLKIKVYPVEGGFVVADHGGWLPGFFATEQAARRAAEMPYEVLQALQDRKNDEAGGAGGVITDSDLDPASS